jgi:hypothetical protein
MLIIDIFKFLLSTVDPHLNDGFYTYSSARSMREYYTTAWLLKTPSSKLKVFAILCQNSWARPRQSTTNSDLIRSLVTTWIRKKSDSIIVYYISPLETITAFIRRQIGRSNLLVTSLVRIRNKIFFLQNRK